WPSLEVFAWPHAVKVGIVEVGSRWPHAKGSTVDSDHVRTRREDDGPADALTRLEGNVFDEAPQIGTSRAHEHPQRTCGHRGAGGEDGRGSGPGRLLGPWVRKPCQGDGRAEVDAVRSTRRDLQGGEGEA